MNSDWDESWNEYSDMLFAVDENQKIIGTFFSKGDFIFNNDNTITGTNIMWLPVNNKNEKQYDDDDNLLPPYNIKYLFHRDMSSSVKKIYEITEYQKYDKRTITFGSIKEYIIQEPSTKEYLSKKTTLDLLTDISSAHSLLKKNLESLMQKGGAPERFGIKGDEFDDEEFKQMENLVNDFEKFVDAFITYPTVLKLNSLSVEQVNQLFGRNDSKNNININIDNQQFTDSTEVKDRIFEFLFYSLKIDYNHNNANMKTDVVNQFVINEEQTKKSTEIATNIDIYKDFRGVDIEPNAINTIIHIKHLSTLLSDMVISLKNDISSTNKSNINIINDVFDIIVHNINTITNNFQKDVSLSGSSKNITKKLLNIIKSLEINNKDFITSFEKCIKDNVSDKIITFVKINNFGHNFKIGKNEVSKWNKRFDVLLNSITDINPTLNTMIVKYNDINKPYYDDGEKIENIEDTKYTKQYLFGKFSKIFPPNMKNPDIANQMTQIVEKVKGGKPVFIMGYGASGSGKTSSLINLKQDVEDQQGKPIEINTPGIIIDMCKQICQGDDGFKQIVLNTEELFQNDENNKETYNNCKPEDKISNCVSNIYTYNYNQSIEKFVLDSNNSQDYETKHSYRKPGDIPKDNFGKLLEYLIDNDRLVKATTNNLQSSRSHSFAFIKFIRQSEPKNGYLIVGDFAGVENTFNCDNIVTIRDFLNIKNKDTDKTYYGGNHPEDVDAIITDYIYLYNRVYNVQLSKTNLNKINTSLMLTSDTSKIIDNDLVNLDNRNVSNKITKQKKIDVKEKFLTDYKIKILDFCKKYIEYAKSIDKKNSGSKKTTNLTSIAISFEKNVSNVYSTIENKKILKAQEEEKSVRTQLTREQNKQKKAEKAEKAEKERIAKVLQEEENRKKQQEASEKENQERIEIKEKKKQERIEQERLAKIAIQQQKEKENAVYIELSKKEINKDYLLDQINLIYEKYKTTLLNTMNNPKKQNELGRFNEEGIKNYFYDFMKNILKNDFINNDLTINMEIFSKYRIDDMYALLNSMKDSIKIQTTEQLVDDITKLNTEHIPYYYVDKEPFTYTNNNSDWKELLKKYESDWFSPLINTNINNNSINIQFIEKYKTTNLYNDARSEILNSHLFTDEYLKTTKTDLVSNKKINTRVTPIFDLENEILEKVKLVLTNILKRLEYGKQICSHRRYEGYFINQSLQDMREDIKNIFYEKQKDSIFISPDYVNLCLEKYCPTHSDCFNKGATSENHTIKSIIFQKIFQFLSKDKQYTVNQFYQDILVSVFCVFNISRSANNPPSVPYIDINELKIALKKYEKSLEKYIKNKTYDVYVYEFQNNLKYLKTNLEKTYYKITGKILGEKKKSITSNTTMQQYNNIVKENSLDNVYDTNPKKTKKKKKNQKKLIIGGDNEIQSIKNENTFDEFQTSSIQQVIFEKQIIFEYIFTGPTSITSKLNINKVYVLIPDDFRFLYKLIEIIDNNNAVSAIGTLEFLDQISKYHTTNTICFLDNDQNINTTDYINIYDDNGKFNLKPL
jgi:hypothetical protein